jgi:hypothetical protein
VNPSVAVRCCLALVLVAAAVLKLVAARTTQSALATFGLRGSTVRGLTWAAIVGLELTLAAGVIAGSTACAYGAAVLLALFAAALAAVLARGRGGAPCGCFGSRSRVSRLAVIRSVVLAGAFAAIPSLPGGELTTDQWLTVGVAFALLTILALAIAVLALAREVGMLRMQLAPQGALEIPDEGPEIGSRSGIIRRFAPSRDEELALAVFSSEGCPACRAVEPAVAGLAQHPLVALQVFEEHADEEAWSELGVPGSPFAVALDRGGTVLAKGTFNTSAQLESVLATAERRRSVHP